MSYSEINARRALARKLWECRDRPSCDRPRWHDLPEKHKREYERDAEILFNPNDQEVRDALRVLGFRHTHDGSA